MRKPLLPVAALLLAGCTSTPAVIGMQAAVAPAAAPPTSVAAAIEAADVTIADFTVLPPPARYATAGIAAEAAGRIDYVYVTRAEAERICAGAGACSSYGLIRCRITIADDYDPRFLAAMIDHERAHCGGWPYNHPL